jgi:hypothetical protein
MKVFDLQCSARHSFEGWFGSEADFVDQLARQLIQCPVCGDSQLEKMLSAPRLNLGRNVTPQTESADATAPALASSTPANEVALASPQTEATQTLLRLAKAMLEQTQDVGSQFAEEARKIHYGESEARAIRGQATLQQTRELLEEGVQIIPFVLPESLKGPLQ